jgi:hypothetical protein
VLEPRQVGAPDEGVAAGLVGARDVLGHAGVVVVQHDGHVRALGRGLEPPTDLVAVDADREPRVDQHGVERAVARLDQAARAALGEHELVPAVAEAAAQDQAAARVFVDDEETAHRGSLVLGREARGRARNGEARRRSRRAEGTASVRAA